MAEKRTLTAQLGAWFHDRGLPFVGYGGYTSEALERQIAAEVNQDGRPAALLYAGDHDPNGEDIDRNLEHQLA